MRVMVDTNVLISALLFPKSLVAGVLTDILTLYIDDLRPNIEAGIRAGFRCMHVTDDKWIGTVAKELL